jgi:hypothetical protein
LSLAVISGRLFPWTATHDAIGAAAARQNNITQESRRIGNTRKLLNDSETPEGIFLE